MVVLSYVFSSEMVWEDIVIKKVLKLRWLVGTKKKTTHNQKHFAESKHVPETKIISQDPLIYFFPSLFCSVLSLLLL